MKYDSKNEIQLYEETLGWINEERIRRGWSCISKIPKGEIANCDRCPVAKALSTRTDPTSIGLNYAHRKWIPEPEHIELPTFIKQFVHDFDERNYPELIEESSDEQV